VDTLTEGRFYRHASRTKMRIAQPLGTADKIASGILEKSVDLLNIYEAQESPGHKGEFGVELLWKRSAEPQVRDVFVMFFPKY
jgi:hypothetical protein